MVTPKPGFAFLSICNIHETLSAAYVPSTSLISFFFFSCFSFYWFVFVSEHLNCLTVFVIVNLISPNKSIRLFLWCLVFAGVKDKWCGHVFSCTAFNQNEHAFHFLSPETELSDARDED